MPVQLGKVIAGQAGAGVTEGVKAGVQEAVKEEVQGAVTPARARATLLVMGTTVCLVLFSAVERRRRLKRLEEKLEVVVEEVAATG